MTSRLLVDKIEGKTTTSTVEMPEGSVIQYKFQTSSDKITVTTSSFTATSVSISFTPKFATSLIQVFWDGHIVKTTSAAGGFGWQLYKDSTALHDIGQDNGNKPWTWYKDETRKTGRVYRTHTHLAENTNARTYTCKFKSYESNHQLVCNNDSGAGGEEEIMTVMEIAQ